MIRAILLAALLVLAGCTPAAVQTQVTVADAIAAAVNPATLTLAESYARRGEELVELARTREEALDLLAAHRASWRPLWDALDLLAAAHDAWATGLEQGATNAATVEAVREAWCEMAGVAAELDVQLPEVVPCP